MQNVVMGGARCTVPVFGAHSMRPQTGGERDSGERRAREPL